MRKILLPLSVSVMFLFAGCAKKANYECNCTWTDSSSQPQTFKYTLQDYTQEQAEESCADKEQTHKTNDGSDASCTLTKL